MKREALDKIIVDARGEWKLSRHNPAVTLGFKDKTGARAELEKLKEELSELQLRLYASAEHGLLVVLQGIDTSGKDGAIRKVFSGVNPQGCRVASFKAPSLEERNHDFLWRIHQAAPPRGQIVVFNRSHYEDVIVTRVHADKLLPGWARARKKLWEERFRQINEFERGLAENNIVVLKFFLNISKDEQKARLQARLDDPAAQWKFSLEDLAERVYWDEYMHAFQQVLKHTSTDHAPWHVVPGNHKWVRDVVIARVLVTALKKLKVKYPAADPEKLKGVVIRAALENNLD